MRAGFNYSHSQSLEDATFIGESCMEASEWMQSNCTPEETASFMIEAFYQDECEGIEEMKSVLVSAIVHGFWYVVTDFLECLRNDMWFGPIIYADQLAEDEDEEDEEED
ncbi:MAG: hypothetical protein IJV90_06890 [Candidatus Methanomethylophilaceae archaeon]|nr:hypothetical protein [Candidatus Methanomethylophilaceae archaeon]